MPPRKSGVQGAPTLPQGLIEAAYARRLIPFVGAGLSVGLGLPTWIQLINRVATELKMDPEVAQLHGDFLQIAECLFYRDGGLGKLRSQLDRIFNRDDIDITKSASHLLLPRLRAPAIYTTNYDNLIERGFEHAGVPYEKIVTVRDMVEADARKTQIVKFHGDFSRDESLVLTESQYFSRLDFDQPLDIRLRSDLLGRTVLFLVYSFSDINIRFMWYKLTQLMAVDSTLAYIVTYRPNPIFEEICRRSRRMVVLNLDPMDPEGSLRELLEILAIEAGRGGQ